MFSVTVCQLFFLNAHAYISVYLFALQSISCYLQNALKMGKKSITSRFGTFCRPLFSSFLAMGNMRHIPYLSVENSCFQMLGTHFLPDSLKISRDRN